MKPKVTVLTTVYNGSHFLKEAIESTLNQTYKEFEYLIIDDCSVDGSVRIIESYDDSRIRLIQNETNLGTARTINRGLSITDSEYLVRADQDDVSLPTRIEKQIEYLENSPATEVVCSWEHAIDDDGNKLWDWKTEIENYGEFLGPVLLGLCPIWHPSIVFRTSALIYAGGFNADYVGAEDFEVTTRMALKRFNAAVVPEFLLLQRQHGKSQSVQLGSRMTNVTRRIHIEALRNFIDGQLLGEFAEFLRTASLPSIRRGFKFRILKFNEMIHELFESAEKKQSLSVDEVRKLKIVFMKRLGLGLFFCHKFKFVPEFFFNLLFAMFSPLTHRGLRRSVAGMYRVYRSIRLFDVKKRTKTYI